MRWKDTDMTSQWQTKTLTASWRKTTRNKRHSEGMGTFQCGLYARWSCRISVKFVCSDNIALLQEKVFLQKRCMVKCSGVHILWYDGLLPLNGKGERCVCVWTFKEIHTWEKWNVNGTKMLTRVERRTGHMGVDHTILPTLLCFWNFFKIKHRHSFMGVTGQARKSRG